MYFAVMTSQQPSLPEMALSPQPNSFPGIQIWSVSATTQLLSMYALVLLVGHTYRRLPPTQRQMRVLSREVAATAPERLPEAVVFKAPAGTRQPFNPVVLPLALHNPASLRSAHHTAKRNPAMDATRSARTTTSHSKLWNNGILFLVLTARTVPPRSLLDITTVWAFNRQAQLSASRQRLARQLLLHLRPCSLESTPSVRRTRKL